MIKAQRHSIFFFIPTLLGMFFFAACGNSNEELEALQQHEKLPQLISTKITIEYSDNARLKAKVKALVLKEYGPPENYTVLPQGVDVSFYDERGKITSTMHADSAIIRRNSDIMEAYQNVKVENKDGERLETQILFWRNSPNPGEKELYTHDFVTITQGSEVMYGNGLKANESFSNYRILKPQGSFYVKDENKP